MPRQLSDITADLNVAREKRDNILRDVEKLFALADGKEMTEGQAERYENLKAGSATVQHQIESFEDESRSALIEMASDPRYGYAGADPGHTRGPDRPWRPTEP